MNRRTVDLIPKVKDGELRVDGDPEMEDGDRADDNDEDHPSPISNVESDEQIGGRDGARCDRRSEFDPTEVEGAAGDRDGEGEDEVGDEETDDGLIKSVEHVHEELGSIVLLPSDSSSVELRNRLASFRTDILIELKLGKSAIVEGRSDADSRYQAQRPGAR